MADGDILLSVENLRVEYLTTAGPVRAVDDVSFTLYEGDVFGLAGESGSGKSTIVQALLRLLKSPAAITGGHVWFRGEDVLSMNATRLRHFRWREVALVFQSAMNALNPVMTVGEQIADVIIAHERVTSAIARDRAGALLELVGIERSRLDSYPHELSGGMRQRVVIAIALALEPPLLLMDEPTTALDVLVQRDILARISELRQELGFSILFITHDLGLMLQMCTRIGILYSARLVETAPTRTISATPAHPYTKGLLASFPDVHDDRRDLVGIRGTPPDLKSPPPGCRFHPRCDVAMPQCREDVPTLLARGPAHDCACHLDA